MARAETGLWPQVSLPYLEPLVQLLTLAGVGSRRVAPPSPSRTPSPVSPETLGPVAAVSGPRVGFGGVPLLGEDAGGAA